MKQILFFIIALVGLLSCTGQQSTNKILGHADSMLNSNDDSCLAVTSLLDGQRQNRLWKKRCPTFPYLQISSRLLVGKTTGLGNRAFP